MSTSYLDVLPLCQGLGDGPNCYLYMTGNLVLMFKNPETTKVEACHKLKTAGIPAPLSTVKPVCSPRKKPLLVTMYAVQSFHPRKRKVERNLLKPQITKTLTPTMNVNFLPEMC